MSLLLFAAIGAALTGCGSSGPVPIEATFVVDGEPLSRASITFVRDDGGGGRAAIGITRDDGGVSLTTYRRHDGVLPGDYRVVVIKAPLDPNTFEEEQPKAPANAQEMLLASSGLSGGPRPIRRRRVRSTLPEVYTDPGTTPLTCTVSSSQREYAFEINTVE